MWISVDERLPEENADGSMPMVLIACEDGVCSIGACIDGQWADLNELRDMEARPSHWMPLPAPPEDE